MKKYRYPSHTFHICYVHCPKCGKGGQLNARIEKYKDHWNGPYFSVKHTTTKYRKSRLNKLKEKGLSPIEIQQTPEKFDVVYSGCCYFGKNIPSQFKSANRENMNRLYLYMETENENLKYVGKHAPKLKRINNRCENCGKNLKLLPFQIGRRFCTDKCYREYDAKHAIISTKFDEFKIQQQEYAQEWKNKHPEKVKAKHDRKYKYDRQWIKNNPEKRRAIEKRYYKKHPQKLKKKQKKYYEKHSEEIKLKVRLRYWRKKSSEKAKKMVAELEKTLESLSHKKKMIVSPKVAQEKTT